MSVSSKLIRSTATSIVLAGGDWGRVSRKLRNVGKENAGSFRLSCLRTDNHGQEGGLSSQVLQPWLLPGPGLSPAADLAKSTPGQGHWTSAVFIISPGPLRKPWVGHVSNRDPSWIQWNSGVRGTQIGIDSGRSGLPSEHQASQEHTVRVCLKR